MKARRKNSDENWKEIKYIQLENSDILFKKEYLEFDTLSTELKTNEQINNEKHWQDVRERAAVAAMQGLLANSCILGDYEYYATSAIEHADALVEQLKKKL